MLLAGVSEHEREILRLTNGSWIQISAPSWQEPKCLLERVDLGVDDADVVLLSTPLADPWRRAFVAGIQSSVGLALLVEMPVASAAHGALLAGRRIERDIPHYLDRLEQISLIVLREGEPVLTDLVPANATVPANREFQSKPITSLSWPGGAANVDFYLRKGGEFRKWRTPDQRPPSESKPLEMLLRQMPAQGRARLSATSADWETLRSNPIFLDWSTLIVESRSFEEIAAELKPRPIIPQRVTTQAHVDAWHSTARGEPLSQILLYFSPANDALVAKLGRGRSAGKVPFEMIFLARGRDTNRMRTLSTTTVLFPSQSMNRL